MKSWVHVIVGGFGGYAADADGFVDAAGLATRPCCCLSAGTTTAMASDAELQQWRKNRDRSRRSLLGDAIFGAFGMLILIGSFFLVGHRLPTWLFLVGLAAVWFQFVGDWINVRTLDRRIAEAERTQN